MPGPVGVLIGVGAVALTGGVAAGYFGALALSYSVGLAGTGALSIVGGAILPCLARKYVISGTVTFANGANSPVTVHLQDGKTRQVTVDAPPYEFTGLAPGAYVVSVSGIEHHRFDVVSRQVVIQATDAEHIDFTVTFKAATKAQWNVVNPITYGGALGLAHLNASLVRTDTAPQQPILGTPRYTYASGKPLNKGNDIVEMGKVLTVGEILPAGTHTLRVDFTVTDETSFRLPGPATVKLVVEQALPTVVFANNVIKQYSEALDQNDVIVSSTFQGQTVEGSCDIALDTRVMGARNLEVRFKPTNNQNFKSVVGNVQLQVDRCQLRIAWAPPAAIDHGTPLSGAQLNAHLEPFVPGKIVYTPAGGSVLAGGLRPLTAHYVASVSQQAHYISPPDLIVNLQVRPVAPVVTADPAQLDLNPGLLQAQHITTRAQFNNVDVPGVFTYLPPLNTPLNVGTQNVTVGFTPNDAASFLPNATAVVTLNVVRVTAAQRQALGIGAQAEQHILRGDVDAVLGTLDGAHSPKIFSVPPLANYQTRNMVIIAGGARSMEVRTSYGPGNANWTAWKSSTLPPANWDDDMLWDATSQTLTAPASRVQQAILGRWMYTANIPTNPGFVRWKVIRDPTDKVVITSYPY